MKLSYELDLVNGMQYTNANDELTAARFCSVNCAAEPGTIAFERPEYYQGSCRTLGAFALPDTNFERTYYHASPFGILLRHNGDVTYDGTRHTGPVN